MSCSRTQHGDPSGARTRDLDPESQLLTTRPPCPKSRSLKMVDRRNKDDGRVPGKGYTISSHFEPGGSAELKRIFYGGYMPKNK